MLTLRREWVPEDCQYGIDQFIPHQVYQDGEVWVLEITGRGVYDVYPSEGEARDAAARDMWEDVTDAHGELWERDNVEETL